MNTKEHTDRVEGGCFCGDVRYELDEPPFLSGYCHCKQCQKGVGNLFSTTVFFKHAHFRFTLGNPVWYETAVAARGFCGRCGTPIAFQHNDSKHIAIMLGTLDKSDRFEPQVHWYSDSKLPWADIQSTLPDATDNLGTYRE